MKEEVDMPKYNYDPKEYENEFTFEPNRNRRKRKFQQEREQVKPHQDWTLQDNCTDE